MKKLFTIFLFLISFNIISAEIDTVLFSSKIEKVTVFFDGAQITQKAKLKVQTGKHILIFDKLPVELNPQSIQVSTDNNGKILSVKHDITHPSENNEIIKKQEDRIKQKEIEIKYIENKISVLTLEERILLENSKINKENGATTDELKTTATFYRQKLEEIKNGKLDLELKVISIKDEIQNMYLELNRKIAEVNKSFSKIIISFENKTLLNSNIEISYYVTSAGWSPLYDFRVNNISNPLNLIYNANIYQSTGENWNNVDLTLSTNRPSLSNEKPVLAPWYLNRRSYSREKKENMQGQSAIKGTVIDEDTGEPVPFANILIVENNRQVGGATSDFQGKYTIKPVKSGIYDIKVTFIGYKTRIISGVILKDNVITFLDIEMESSSELLESVEVINYKVPLIDKDYTTSGATVTAEEISRMPNRSARATARTVGGVNSYDNRESNIYLIDGQEASESISGIEYEINIPYTIPSDGNDYTVKIKEISLPVDYIYYSIPKLEEDVFLTSEISNWSSLDILPGMASIYYNGVFTGETAIDAVGSSDTITVSLSRDRDIFVQKKLIKEKNEKQFLGKNIRELFNWSFTIKNNKPHAVKLIIEDQLPISENKALSVEIVNISNAIYDEKSGSLKWTKELNAGEKIEFDLIYSIKYPNYMNIITE